jgi:hypothetical protein
MTHSTPSAFAACDGVGCGVALRRYSPELIRRALAKSFHATNNDMNPVKFFAGASWRSLA